MELHRVTEGARTAGTVREHTQLPSARLRWHDFTHNEPIKLYVWPGHAAFVRMDIHLQRESRSSRPRAPPLPHNHATATQSSPSVPRFAGLQRSSAVVRPEQDGGKKNTHEITDAAAGCCRLIDVN